MSIALYVVAYLLGSVISFFALSVALDFKVKDAGILVFASLIYPVVWLFVFVVGGWFWLVELAEKYLEAQNEKDS